MSSPSSTAMDVDTPSPATFTIKVKTLQEEKFPLQVSLSMTVLALKTTIEELKTIPIAKQRLICRGKVMKDNLALSNYKLEPNSTIHLVVRKEPTNQTSPASPTESMEVPPQESQPSQSQSQSQPQPFVSMMGSFTVPQGSPVPNININQILSSAMSSLSGQSQSQSQPQPSQPQRRHRVRIQRRPLSPLTACQQFRSFYNRSLTSFNSSSLEPLPPIDTDPSANLHSLIPSFIDSSSEYLSTDLLPSLRKLSSDISDGSGSHASVNERLVSLGKSLAEISNALGHLGGLIRSTELGVDESGEDASGLHLRPRGGSSSSSQSTSSNSNSNVVPQGSNTNTTDLVDEVVGDGNGDDTPTNTDTTTNSNTNTSSSSPFTGLSDIMNMIGNMSNASNTSTSSSTSNSTQGTTEFDFGAVFSAVDSELGSTTTPSQSQSQQQAPIDTSLSPIEEFIERGIQAVDMQDITALLVGNLEPLNNPRYTEFLNTSLFQCFLPAGHSQPQIHKAASTLAKGLALRFQRPDALGGLENFRRPHTNLVNSVTEFLTVGLKKIFRLWIQLTQSDPVENTVTRLLCAFKELIGGLAETLTSLFNRASHGYQLLSNFFTCFLSTAMPQLGSIVSTVIGPRVVSFVQQCHEQVLADQRNAPVAASDPLFAGFSEQERTEMMRTMALDDILQRELAPQRPFSDAYRGGGDAKQKKRKISDSATIDMRAGLRKQVLKAVESENGSGVAIDSLPRALVEKYEEQLSADLSSRIVSDGDSDPSKFPYSAKLVERSKK